MSSLRNALAALANPKPVSVNIPLFEEPVYLKRMTVAELFAYLGRVKDKDPVESSAITLSLALVNEDGTPIFDIAKKEDRELLGALPPNVAMDLTTKFRDMNRMTGEASASAPDAS